MEQIQFLLGHVSVQTTERYLGCKQRIRGAVNDRIGIEPEVRLLQRSASPTTRQSENAELWLDVESDSPDEYVWPRFV